MEDCSLTDLKWKKVNSCEPLREKKGQNYSVALHKGLFYYSNGKWNMSNESLSPLHEGLTIDSTWYKKAKTCYL